MMTTILFNPSPLANFQFNPVLDGTTYVCICTWNAAGPRYFFSIYDTFGNLIVSRPIIGSPDDYDINLLFGYFKTSTMVFRSSSNSFIISP